MAQDLEKLVVSLEANLKQFERELARAQGLSVSKLRKIEKDMQASATRVEQAWARVGAGIKSGLVGALGAVTIGKIANGITDLIAKFGQLADEAERAGVSAEFLQGLGLAAIDADVKVSDIVDLIQKFNLEIGEAATKGGPLKDLLDANGVAIRDANGNLRDTQSLFFDIVDLVKNARSQQEAAVVAQIAFGKASKDALPFLMQGADALKRGVAAAKETGGVVDEELVKAADEFGARWDHAWAVWQGQAAQKVLTVAKLIDGLMAKAEKFFKAGDSAAVSLYKAATGQTPPSGNISQFDLFAMNNGGSSTTPQKDTVIPGGGGIGNDAVEVQKTTQAVEDLGIASEDMLDIARDATDAWIKAQQDAQQAVVDLGELGFDSLWSIVEGSKSAKEALHDLVMQLAKLAFQGALFGQGPFAALTGGQGNGLFNMLGASLFPARASGGPVNAGQPYMVGERGRELFVPSQSGRVISNGALRGDPAKFIVHNYAGAQIETQRSGPNGKDLVLMIKSIGASEFAGNLQKHAPLIGSRPASKRTS